MQSVLSITEKQHTSIIATSPPLKARTNTSSVTKVSTITSDTLVKDSGKINYVDICNQMPPELFSNEPHNLLEVCKIYVYHLTCFFLYKV